MIVDTGDAATNYTLSVGQIIEEAFDLCGIGSEGESINSDMYARGLRSLNLLIKSWGTEDHLWIRTERSVELIAGQAEYVLDPKPMRVQEVRRHNIASGIETPMSEWARSTYLEQPNKLAQSIPTSFYYDPQKASGMLYVWPAPSVATAAQFDLQLTYLRTLEDCNGPNDAVDLPQEWIRALSYGLAEELAVKYDVAPSKYAVIASRAKQFKDAIESWDTEPASLFLQPEQR